LYALWAFEKGRKVMKKIVFAIASVLAIGAASGVSAQTMSPTGSFTFSGNVTMQQSVTANCNVSGTGSNSSSGGTLSGSFSPGNILYCGPLSLVKPYGAWSFDVIPGVTDKVRVTIGANTVLNKPCYGTFDADWNNATSTITFNNNPLPPVNVGDPSCTIVSGSVKITPARTIS